MSDAEKRREFQAMSSARQWWWFANQLLSCALVYGFLLGIPLHLFGVSFRVNTGIIWLVAVAGTFSILLDRLKKPEEP